MQKLSTLKNFAFDKTGTLTTGKFEIKDIKTFGITLREARSALYSLERYSTHPIAASLSEKLKEETIIELSDIKEEKGLGIRGTDNEGNVYAAGSFRLVHDEKIEKDHEVYLLKNNKVVAAVDIADEIKPEAKETFEFFKSKKINTVLISGDKIEKCNEIAGKLGIDSVYAEQLPTEKLTVIEHLDKGNGVAMVGDGINDAPALSKATVGISLSNATQVAIKSAQVVLLNGKINLLMEAYLISKNTMTIIRQNLFWAFFYNIIAIPIAAVGMLNPMIAAASMALSDVVVITNSLRLRKKKLR